MANSLHRAYDLDIIAPSGSTKVLVVTEDEFQFAYATIDAIQTPLDVAGLATDADITSLSASIAALSGSIGVSGSYSTQDKFFATNNGGGQNFKVGDDAWIGDVNRSNTIQVSGVQNAATGYIKFASGSNTPVIGSNGANRLNIANIPTYANNAAALAGGLVAGDIYIYTASDFLAIVH